MRKRWLLPMGCCAVFAGCAVGPTFKPPHEPVPDQYAGVHADADAPAAAATASTDGVPRPADDRQPATFWWREFHDPDLDRLVDQAMHGNLDLKAAYVRIVEARLQVQSARAQGLPSVNATASYNREQLGLAGILKSQGFKTGPTTPAAEQSLISALESPVNIYQVGFDASWELDLFGKVRRAVEAANAQSEGAVESRNDALVSLEAEVAQSYLQLRAGQVLKAITLDLIKDQHEVLDLTNDRYVHGLSGEPDVESARAQLASLESQLPQFEQTIASTKHALAVLVGRDPEALDGEFGANGELPPFPAQIPIGVPSTLARRRPDIRESEAALHAATAEIGVSVASLFPDVSLSGTFGVRSTGTQYLFDWQSKFYTLGPTISMPIFHGGALIANVRMSRAQTEEAALNYRKTVLNALQEVEDGLTGMHEDAARSAALKETVAADERALEIDLNSYRHGVITYISVLTVQLQANQARQQLAQALLTQSTDLVRLYKALGGGWEDAPTVRAE